MKKSRIAACSATSSAPCGGVSRKAIGFSVVALACLLLVSMSAELYAQQYTGRHAAFCTTYVSGDETRSDVVWGSGFGDYPHEARAAAMASLEQRSGPQHHMPPNCRVSLDRFFGDSSVGWVTIIRAQTTNHQRQTISRLAVGFGATQSASRAEAIEEMRRRNWAWNESHGHEVVQQFSFRRPDR